MRLDTQLQSIAAAAFSEAYGVELPAGQFSIQKTRKEFAGDRTLVCQDIEQFERSAGGIDRHAGQVPKLAGVEPVA